MMMMKKLLCHCRLSCRTQLGTVHTPYPWRGNSYNSSSRERRERGRVSGITIRIVSTGQYIYISLHPTYNTESIIIITNSRHEQSLHCYTLNVYQVIPTNMTPTYRTINSITQSYIHAWIVWGTDGHGHRHDNKFTK